MWGGQVQFLHQLSCRADFVKRWGARPAVRTALLASALLVAGGCQREPAPRPTAATPEQRTAAPEPRTANGVREAAWTKEEDGQWAMAAKNWANTRYSRLDQINTGNVNQLRQVWSFNTGIAAGHEAAPLVVGDTMYVVTPYPNVLYALDVRDGGLRWSYRPRPVRAAQGVACCDVVNRGAAYADGRIFFNTLDNHTVAVDAKSGKEVWKTKLGDINLGESMTMAPLVAGNRVLVGNSGGEFGVRGWITALEAGSGKIAWRAYHTGPDKDALIGADFRPFYAGDRGEDLGVKTWPPGQWKIGGGTVWGWISYDPELDMVYYGTGNPGPWNPELREGDNKWTCGLFARRLSDGAAIWFVQFVPHDEHDYDGVNESILVDMPWRGEERKVLLHPERTGFMYVIDRTNGEILSAEPFAHTNWATGVDLQTSRPIKNEEKATGLGKVVRNVCPAAPGAKDWQPSAFSPRTGLLYIPHNNLCMDFEGLEANYIAGTPYVGAEVKMMPGPSGHRGEFTAWDPAAAKAVWKIEERFPAWSGALATAGDVVFYGTMDRWFKAVNAVTGQNLWQHRLGSGIVSQPSTFRGPDGKQYLAVMSGVGGWAGAIVSGQLSAEDGTGALGFVNAMKDLPEHTAAGGAVHVFALP
ncbi:MAG: methanol/ethanol family PQQ-dependent dehydrogenase [Bryobacteraceae bacterium]|nr:methanol/ethanol family PQQ-dependent dehydrogenase [Bryobacteraceae bacterium]